MRVLVICAHPDDETLGMGGTIARHIALGDEVRVLCLTDGVKARGGDVKEQQANFNKAMAILGVHQSYYTLLENQKLDVVPLLEINRQIEGILPLYPAVRVYTHCAADLNQDHRRTLEAALVACRPLPRSPVKQLLSFMPTTGWHPTETFSPRYYVDVTDHWQKKEQALVVAYPHELKDPPHYRSLEALRRTAESTANIVGMSGRFEAFEVLRWVE